MAISIKNREVEQLLEDVVRMTGESKTEAVRKALADRRRRLSLQAVMRQDSGRLLSFLQEEIWPQVSVDLMGTRLSKEAAEDILGLGDLGV